MDDIGSAISVHLKGRMSLFGLVGSRIRPDRPNQGERLPAIAYREISSNSVEHLNGNSGLAVDRMQIDCYADRMTESKVVRKAVCAAMQNFRGQMSGIEIRSVQVAGRTSGTEKAKDGSDQDRYIATIDFRITYIEPVITHI